MSDTSRVRAAMNPSLVPVEIPRVRSRAPSLQPVLCQGKDRVVMEQRRVASAALENFCNGVEKGVVHTV